MITTMTETALLEQLRREVTELRAQLLQLRCELSAEVRTRRLVVVDRDGHTVVDARGQTGAGGDRTHDARPSPAARPSLPPGMHARRPPSLSPRPVRD